MEKIEPGKFVEFAYNLYEVTPEGEDLVYQTPDDSPETIIFGVTEGVFVPLEKALEGLKPGDKFDVKAKPAEAFGEYDPERVVELEKQIFEVDGKFDTEMVKAGAMLPMLNAYGQQMIGRVVEVGDKTVKMDFNHMLAGKDVRFEGVVKAVREATPEELHPAHSCCGGCGCYDGGCGNGGCNDGGCGCDNK